MSFPSPPLEGMRVIPKGDTLYAVECEGCGSERIAQGATGDTTTAMLWAAWLDHLAVSHKIFEKCRDQQRLSLANGNLAGYLICKGPMGHDVGHDYEWSPI